MKAVGVTRDGGFQEYCTIPAGAAVKFPAVMPPEVAAFAEPVACCLHGIDLTRINAGNSVLIIGAGPIGLIMLQLAQHSGASRVSVVEPDECKRSLAKKLGADETFACAEGYIAQNIRTDRVIECAGKAETVTAAIKAASKGAVVMLFGLTPPKAAVEIFPFEIFKKELTITSSFVNPYTQHRAVELLAAGKVDVKPLVGEFIPLEKLAEALREPVYRNKMKIMVKF
jgi:threonine dehydrogenase-like Zn-dependent dehydrogenase